MQGFPVVAYAWRLVCERRLGVVSTTKTTIGRCFAAGLAALVSVAILWPATAQKTEELTVEVGDCVELTSPSERLACFEAQVEAAQKDRSPAGDRPSAPEASRRAPEPAVRAPAAEPADRAPVRAEPARVRDREQERSSSDERGSDAAPAEIVARIADLRQTVPNNSVITLDNGQVWRQSRAMPYPLQAGAEVRIYETDRWGYRLTIPARRGFISVERVR